MEIRYPKYIEEEIEDVNELISLNEELISNQSDDSLKNNLSFLKNFRKDLTQELNESYESYRLVSFDTIIEKEGKIPSVYEVTKFLSNFQNTLYSLAESALNKVMKGSKISEEVLDGATIGISKASKGSLKIHLKPVDMKPSFQPYLKIATDKLNVLLDCGSDENLLKEQVHHLGSQPIYKYKTLLKDIQKDEITVTLFDEIKPRGYKTQIITPKFAENVYSAIVQTEPETNSYTDEITGELIVINGKKNEITVSSKDENGKDKDYNISFDSEQFSSSLGKYYKEQVNVKISIIEKYYELEEDTKFDLELIKITFDK